MKTLLILLGLLSSTVIAVCQTIDIRTLESQLVLRVDQSGTLHQIYLGKALTDSKGIEYIAPQNEAYITNGMKDYFEPALHVRHWDGNPSLELKYKTHHVATNADGSVCTVIEMADDKYPFAVELHYTAYADLNVIKTFAVIEHRQKAPITMYGYASSMLHLRGSAYYLTDFTGDWAREVNMTEQRLTTGKRIVDTKLGSRAGMFSSPFFMVAIDQPAAEESGQVLLGTLAWTGNFRYTFEIDQLNSLRIISGINPMASEYILEPNTPFVTPEFIFTLSSQGVGHASRSLHDWARQHQLKDGMKGRMTLLNNWEATYFDFDDKKLSDLLDDAKELGVDMFLLDDGWFANKYPRNSDTQGLGDWQQTRSKLAGGIGRLVEQASTKGLKFGLWIEPEMVNPRSELFEKHHNWVIDLPNRDDYYFRNQMVLDLSNPEVQDFVFSVVDDLMTQYPNIAYFKWDCNSPITNIYSPHLKDKQSHLYVHYVRGLYAVLERIKAKYPNLPMMLCSGGGARADYQALKYFTEFWPSDNTDPVERIFIQWGFSHFLPSKAISAHITSWGDQSLKFKLDVAMMGKLGFDIKLDDLSASDRQLAADAVAAYRQISPIVYDGDLYRLVSPYGGNHAAMMYVSKDRSQAVVYAMDIHPRYGENLNKLTLRGLDPKAHYTIREINLPVGEPSKLDCNNKTYSGDFLISHGIDIFSTQAANSHILHISNKQEGNGK